MQRQLMRELARFGMVTLLGLIVDLAVAIVLTRVAGLPLWLAAAVGFVSGAICNYIIHELWTFTHGARRLSNLRALRYILVVTVSFFARIGTVFLLQGLFSSENAELPILICAVGVSFLLNYVSSRRWVFSN
jgi:putative flippase GtrA